MDLMDDTSWVMVLMWGTDLGGSTHEYYGYTLWLREATGEDRAIAVYTAIPCVAYMVQPLYAS